MAQGNFQPCLDIILPIEGGVVNDGLDPGHLTNLGITQATLQHFYGSQRIATAQDVRDLTPVTVAPIYAIFWKAVHAELLPFGVDLAVFDWEINSGPANGAKGLQRVLGVNVDELVGPKTITAAAKMPANELIEKLSAARLIFDETETNPAEEKQDIKGWTRRINTIERAAKKMAADAGSAAISNA